MKQSSKIIEIAGKQITLQTGLLAQQATSSVLGRMGDTMVLSTVVMGEVNPNLDYFPLSVEYVERLYAGGRIKGSKWVKREGRPSDEAVLTGRLIDRSVRPLFPKDFKKETQVVINVLSVDGQNDPDVLSIVTTSAALAISKIPWNGPIGAVRIGSIGENGSQELVVNPDSTEYNSLDLNLVVTSSAEKAIMLEAGAKQIGEDIVAQAIKMAKTENAKIVAAINEMVKELGDKKEEVKKDENFEKIVMLVEKSYKDEIETLIRNGVDKEVGGALSELSSRVYELEKESESSEADVKKAVDYVFKKTIREMILKEGKRPDGRKIDEVRPISAQVGVLPRTHGSAIFQRGETQVLTVATLGAPSMEQLIEGPEGEEAKRYMHHYSFPPYSVGETGRTGFLSRREIGHGALAERALEPVIPLPSKFPYAIRVVSEVMSSNGSTSQASICGSTLSLMDAGVPLTDPVAGIAIGLMTSPKEAKSDKYVILTDIMGLEDFSGDMDFKVAGTTKGITAIQLDVKTDGLTDQMVDETLASAKTARIAILEKMMSVLPESRTVVSQFAPKIKVVQIEPEKIGEVIGSGGKVIRNIIATTGATVDVDEDGKVTIASVDEEAVEKAANWVGLLTREFQRGEVFEGKVKRILPFGAMVEIVPGKEGLVHVSEMATGYVKNPADVVTIGQVVKVRVKEIDDQGRTNLSMVFGEKEERKTEDRRPEERRPEERRYEDRRPPPAREGYGGRPQHHTRRPAPGKFGNNPRKRY